MWLWAASDIFLPLLCHGYLQGDRKSLCSFRKNNIFTGPKRLPKLHKHTPETSYHSIKLHLKQVFQSVYRGELETKISQKPRKPEITKLPDWSRRKAVAEFRLRVGHDCLGTHLHGSGIRHDPYCMLCSLHEPTDRNHLGQCTALSTRTMWAILGGQDKNDGKLTSSLLYYSLCDYCLLLGLLYVLWIFSFSFFLYAFPLLMRYLLCNFNFLLLLVA